MMNVSTSALVHGLPTGHIEGLEVTAVGEDTLLAEIVRLVEAADLVDHAAPKHAAGADEALHVLLAVELGQLARLALGEPAAAGVELQRLREAAGESDRAFLPLLPLVDGLRRLVVPFGLDLPGHSVKPDAGVEHRHRCLRALALLPS